MKKILLCFVLLLIPMFVNADLLYKDWSGNNINISEIGDDEVFYHQVNNTAVIDDGYITTTMDFVYFDNAGFNTASGEWPFESISTTINYYDKNGDIKKTKVIEDKYISEILVDGDNIYVVSSKMIPITKEGQKRNYIVEIMKFNKELEQVFDIDVTSYLVEYYYNECIANGESDCEGNIDEYYSDINSFYYFSLVANYLGIDALTIEDNSLWYYGLFNIDKDLNNISVSSSFANREEIKEEELSKIDWEGHYSAEEAAKMEFEVLSNYLDRLFINNLSIGGLNKLILVLEVGYIPDGGYEAMINYSFGDTTNVSSGAKVAISDTKPDKMGFVLQLDNGETCKYVSSNAIMNIMDKRNQVIKTIENNNYAMFYNTKIVGKYIITLGFKTNNISIDFLSSESDLFSTINTYHFYDDILIYDLEGNLLNTYSDNKIHSNMSVDGNTLLFGDIFIDSMYDSENRKSFRPILVGSSSVQLYSLKYKIDIINNVGGTLSGSSLAKAGENVILKSSVSEGYYLDYILITYEDGHTEKIKGTSFVMPEGNVTITPVYGVGNPYTKDIIIGTVIVAIVSLISYLVFRRKKRYLNS